MHITLVLPELATALARGDAPPRAPSLARLLARAALHVEPAGWAAALAPLYGVARQQDWPLAPLRAQRRGVAAHGAYWLHATPVTMVPGRDDVRIANAAPLAGDDANAILAVLNAHFAGDAVEFVALAADEWVVRVGRSLSLVTRALDTVIGEPLRPLLPTGDDADEWRRWEQEMQMLLHTHPVNAAREAAGDAPVNGLWFDEGGTTANAPARGGVATFGTDARLAALAHFSGADALPVPASLDAVLASASNQADVIVLPTTTDIAATDDAFGAPAEAALRSGTVERVTIMTAGPQGRIASWTTGRPGMLERLLGGRSRDLSKLVHDALAVTDR